MAVVTERDEIAKSVGKYGWDGGLGTSWYTDPAEEITMPDDPVGLGVPQPAESLQDFWTPPTRPSPTEAAPQGSPPGAAAAHNGPDGLTP